MRTVQKSVLAAGVALVLLALSLPGAVSDADDREATYIGATYLNHGLNEDCAEALDEPACFTRIPEGVISVACDGEGNSYALGHYDGVGGVSFCDIPAGSTITLTMEDEVVEVPEAIVGCWAYLPWTDEHDTGWTQFAHLQGSATVTVPAFCIAEFGDAPNVDLFNIAGTAVEGTTSLEFEDEAT